MAELITHNWKQTHFISICSPSATGRIDFDLSLADSCYWCQVLSLAFSTQYQNFNSNPSKCMLLLQNRDEETWVREVIWARKGGTGAWWSLLAISITNSLLFVGTRLPFPTQRGESCTGVSSDLSNSDKIQTFIRNFTELFAKWQAILKWNYTFMWGSKSHSLAWQDYSVGKGSGCTSQMLGVQP